MSIATKHLFNKDLIRNSLKWINPLSVNPTKGSNTLKQFVDKIISNNFKNVIIKCRYFKAQTYLWYKKSCIEFMERNITSKKDILGLLWEELLFSFQWQIVLFGIFFDVTIPSNYFFSMWVFLSGTFTNHRTAGEDGGHLINSSLPLPPTSQTLRH